VADRSEALVGESTKRPDGIFIVGAFGCGIDALAGALHALGDRAVVGDTPAPGPLAEFNEKLLRELGGSWEHPPEVAAPDVVALLRSWADEGRELFRRALGTPHTAGGNLQPWMWGDPRNSILADFWIEALDVSAIGILVHRAPSGLSREDAKGNGAYVSDALWERYNRAALGVATTIPTLVVGFDDLNEAPPDAFGRISKFLTECQLDIDLRAGEEPLAQGWLGPRDRDAAEPLDVPHHVAVLHRILGRHERMMPSDSYLAASIGADLVRDLGEFYDARAAELLRTSRLQVEAALRQVDELESRRSAEAVASGNALLEYDHRELQLAKQLYEMQAEVQRTQAHIDGILRTRMYRYTSRLRTFYFVSRTSKKNPRFAPLDVEAAPPEVDLPYSFWVSTFDELDQPGRAHLEAQVAGLTDPPLISVLLPVYNTPRNFLDEAIESVRSQTYPNWELCIVDDCSTDLTIAAAMEELARTDPRIKFVRRQQNGHISAASNTALEMATGTWIACLDHDDTLAETALARFALKMAAHPELNLIYSDEDKLSEQGERQDPFFKPEYDPLLLLGQNYFCHLTMIRRDVVERVGGYREGFEGSQDWDLALRAAETLTSDQIGHIPRILYHWRIHSDSTAGSLSAKQYAGGAGERAVRDHIARTGAAGEVNHLPSSGWNRVKWSIPQPAPLVSIVIPTRDGKYLSRCIDSIRYRSTYQNFEILVVDNGSLGHSTLEWLRSHDSVITVIRDESPFNYPDINNKAVARSHGDVVCLLNDDTEVLGGDWLEEMVGQLLQPSVGAVGAKLYYGNGLVQHAGVVLGIGGVAGHAYRMSDRLSFADHGRMQLPRAYSAVTAACMVIRREAWEQVGGMDAANLPVAFNDIDLCLRLKESGWRVVWTPFAELIHHESISRGPDTEGAAAIRFADETRYMQKRWGALLRNDPAYNPNLSLVSENFSLAWPPRTQDG
jgi:glycosyltransferase involved in cell wall biosynthesis